MLISTYMYILLVYELLYTFVPILVGYICACCCSLTVTLKVRAYLACQIFEFMNHGELTAVAVVKG